MPARHYNGVCEEGELCLFFNNAAAGRNTDNYVTARIYFNSGWQGRHDDIRPSTNCRNLVNTDNENASFEWI